MQIGAIIQARLSSTRLPRKVLKELPYGSGISALAQCINRVRKATRIDTLVVATTDLPEDQEIVSKADELQASTFRGSKEDVLSRYFHAAVKYHLDVIVRVTSDCPCIDPDVIDRLVEIHLRNGNDFTSNALQRSFPTGVDVEIFNFDSLQKAHTKSLKPFEREHVTPYFYMNDEVSFRVENLTADGSDYAPEIRITLDTVEDYCLLCQLFDHFQGREFRTADIVALFRAKPWLKKINARVASKKVYSDLQSELADALQLLKFQGMDNAAAILEKATS